MSALQNETNSIVASYQAAIPSQIFNMAQQMQQEANSTLQQIQTIQQQMLAENAKANAQRLQIANETRAKIEQIRQETLLNRERTANWHRMKGLISQLLSKPEAELKQMADNNQQVVDAFKATVQPIANEITANVAPVEQMTQTTEQLNTQTVPVVAFVETFNPDPGSGGGVINEQN